MRKGPGVFELAAEVQSAEKAEHLSQWSALVTEPTREERAGVRPAQGQGSRPVRSRGRNQKDLCAKGRLRHVAALRNFGAHDTIPAVRNSSLRHVVAAILVGASLSCVQPPPHLDTRATTVETPQVDIAPDSAARAHLIDIRLLEPTIMVEAKYATADNFTGAPLPGYEANRALLRREAARALARVQKRARLEGFALKVFDGYRPVRATLAMVEWTERSGRRDLVRDGYIASRSRHNLGLAVDLTLIGGDGQELDMGTAFDTFSSAAHTANATGEAATNRTLLVRLMEAEGFVNYEKEWWHFSYSVADPLRFDLVIR